MVSVILVAVLLTVVLVVGAVISVSMHRKNQASARLDADRREAVVVAEQFALRMDDFAAPSATAYDKRIEQLLTTKGKASFAQVKTVIAEVYKAAQPSKGGAAPTGKIVYAGVSQADDDTATVLVAHDSAIPASTKALHFRWTVELQKINGRWLVDGLPPEVSGGAGQ
jgi:Na+-transporting NADH:ubiquinone oxidoreductase subunit NqrC